MNPLFGYSDSGHLDAVLHFLAAFIMLLSKDGKEAVSLCLVLDHVQYNYSVHWQGEEQSVPCKSSDSNPGFCVCHLVKWEIKHHLIILLVLGSICSILGLSHCRGWVGASGLFYASQHLLGQCVPVPSSRHWWIASICHLIQWLLILALPASSIQTLKVSSQTSVLK